MTSYTSYLFDASAAAGLLLVGVGLWLIWPPVALVAVGAVLLTLGLWGAARWGS